MKPHTAACAALLIAATAAGCAPNPVAYRVAAPKGARAQWGTGYFISNAGPKGAVAVRALGGVRLPVARGLPTMYLHIQILAQNTADDVRWALNPNDQRLTYGEVTVAPAFSRGSGKGPVVWLPKGAQGALDLYFPLPASYPDQVSFEWHVRRGQGVLAVATTAFDRLTGGAGQGDLGWSRGSPDYSSESYGSADRYGDPTSNGGLAPPASNDVGSTPYGSQQYSASDNPNPATTTVSDQPQGNDSPAPPSAPASVEGAADKSAWRGGGNP